MGQHKTNPTAIKAKNGEIPPNPPTPSKAERRKMIQEYVSSVMYSHLLPDGQDISEILKEVNEKIFKRKGNEQ